MELDKRLKLFTELGNYIKINLENNGFKDLLYRAKSQNQWFTVDNLQSALKNIADKFLSEENLQNFVNRYPETYFYPKEVKKVGVIAAGNIPLVGFQDLLNVLLSGHHLYFKPSSQDKILNGHIIEKLVDLAPEIENKITIADRLNNLDAYIATGSGNTSRYFEHYFGKYPNIIRKNRVSVAILNGKESNTQLADLGNDIFNYFGLGCRNVSKLYVPTGYDFTQFFESVEYWSGISIHSKYTNNYDYNKSIMLVNGEKHYDNGFLLVKENVGMHSPISTIYYEEYDSEDTVRKQLAAAMDQLQCIVSNKQEDISFGETQAPELWDFADHIDTIRFLAEL